MHLKSLVLRQFRGYEELTLSVTPALNVFLGPNGSGKTNLLESLAVLTTGVSPRGADPETLVQWGTNGFFIKGEFEYEEAGLDPIVLDMKFEMGTSRQIHLNGQVLPRLRDLVGRVPTVSFVPEDLSLIKGEPSLRRKTVNLILVQVDPVYAEELRKYHEALRCRNAALKQMAEGSITEKELEPWDEALVRSGILICKRRESFINEMSSLVEKFHRTISGGTETLKLKFKPSFSETGTDPHQEWLKKLKSLRSQEVMFRMTLVGPHRDDVEFLLDGRLARAFASEGQKRTGAVAFKMAEMHFIREKKGEAPIFLLDDVLSELDATRAAFLLEELTGSGQCFVTLTGLESWPSHRLRPGSIFKVENAKIQMEKGLIESQARPVVF